VARAHDTIAAGFSGGNEVAREATGVSRQRLFSRHERLELGQKELAMGDFQYK
jgi:hypothetical protein